MGKRTVEKASCEKGLFGNVQSDSEKGLFADAQSLRQSSLRCGIARGARRPPSGAFVFR